MRAPHIVPHLVPHCGTCGTCFILPHFCGTHPSYRSDRRPHPCGPRTGPRQRSLEVVRGCERSLEVVRDRHLTHYIENGRPKMFSSSNDTFVPHLYPIWGTWGTYMICTPLWGTYFNENTALQYYFILHTYICYT